MTRQGTRLSLLPLLAAALLLPAEALAAQPVPDFTVEPAPGSRLAPDGGYFRLAARPGDKVTQELAVRNTSNRPIELRLAAVDAETAAYGGVSYGLASESANGVGKWISLGSETLRLAPRAKARVPFTVAIPAGAASGEHLGGLAISMPSADETQAARGAGQAGASVTIQTRRVIALVVRVPGAIEKKLVVTGVEPTPRADGLYLTIGVANRGGALTKASAVVSLPDDGFTRRFEVDSIVPASSVAYPLKWTARPRDGEHKARVELRYGSKTAVWEGTFTVGEAVREELVDRGGDESGSRPPGRTLTETSLIAFTAGGGGVLLLGVLTWYAVRRRRRSRRRRSGAATPRQATHSQAETHEAPDPVTVRAAAPSASDAAHARPTVDPKGVDGSTRVAPSSDDGAGSHFADKVVATEAAEGEQETSLPPRPAATRFTPSQEARAVSLAAAALAGAVLVMMLGRDRRRRPT